MGGIKGSAGLLDRYPYVFANERKNKMSKRPSPPADHGCTPQLALWA